MLAYLKTAMIFCVFLTLGVVEEVLGCLFAESNIPITGNRLGLDDKTTKKEYYLQYKLESH